MIYTCTIDTPLGAMTAAAEENALVGLWFVGQEHYPTQAARWTSEPAHPVFEAVRGYLASYFSGKTDGLEIRLEPPGSPFQRAVWDVLLRIPRGQVKTYGQIAREIAGAMGQASISAQAVGSAVGHNRISILIPCHRVIGSDGHLRGYAGGLDRKAALLRLEKANLENLK
jgi:methylated-DNA-[protein]-cysteine S-methyltransferase